MLVLLYWIKFLCWRTFYFINHLILFMIYGKKGKVVPHIKNPILLKSAVKLAEEIRERKLKCVDVIQAYISRITEVDIYVNAVVEQRFEQALEEAKEVDAILQSGLITKQELEKEKPLLGVPLTVKILLNVEGFQNTRGSKVYEGQYANKDAPSIAALKRAGCIVIATTNSPEFGLAFETNNLLYGKTSNPYDTTKTPGGSSGGEAALLGAGASVIGIGNDFAGSVRIPAHFTGIFSHKPSLNAISNSGGYITLPPNMDLFLYTGPMCRYAEDLVVLTKILSEDNGKELKFNEKIDFGKLKIYYSTKYMAPSALPANFEIQAAMQRAISHFKNKYGAIVEEVEVELLNQTTEIFLHIFQSTLDNATSFLTSGKVNHLNPVSELFLYLIGKSTFSLWSIFMLGLHKFPLIYNKNKVLYYEQTVKQIDKVFNDMLDENSIFLYPSFPVSAPYHYEMLGLIFNTGYTSIFNIVPYPVTNCPVGLNRNGLPQGLQIVGRKNNDPLTLACAVELSEAFGGWTQPNAGNIQEINLK